jgi:hypothetical protein
MAVAASKRRPQTAAVRLLAGDKEPVRLASTGKLALAGLLTVDGVVTVAGDRILVKDQTDPKQNGVYTASVGKWYHAPDCNSSRLLQVGMMVYVQEGTQAGNVWSVLTNDPNDGVTFTLYLSFNIASTAEVAAATAAEAAVAAAEAAATAVAAAASLVSVPTPQGRLTLTSATPVLSADVINATAVYYMPYVGNLVPIFNGAAVIPTEFAALTLSLNSNHALNAIYDVFVFSNSGVVTLGTGPAWANSAAAAGSRGTGAGSTQLTRVKGLWTNAESVTARNGSNTFIVEANLGTYLGSILINGTAGQVTCHTSYGQSRKWGVWNAYNRKEIMLQAGDSTASWNYTTAAIRASNNSSANSLTVFAGLPEELFDIQYRQNATGGSVSVTSQVIAQWQHGIGWNSTSAMSGYAPITGIRVSGGSIDALLNAATLARHINQPTIGINVATCLETLVSANGSPTVTWSGGNEDMVLTASYHG